MINKSLLKKMVGEVSISTLCELLAGYANSITETEEGSEEMIEILGSIDTVVSELKSRSAKPKKPRKNKEEEDKNATDEQKSRLDKIREEHKGAN